MLKYITLTVGPWMIRNENFSVSLFDNIRRSGYESGAIIRTIFSLCRRGFKCLAAPQTDKRENLSRTFSWNFGLFFEFIGVAISSISKIMLCAKPMTNYETIALRNHTDTATSLGNSVAGNRAIFNSFTGRWYRKHNIANRAGFCDWHYRFSFLLYYMHGYRRCQGESYV